MIVREPVEFMMALVDTGWMNTDGLVVGYISPTLAVTREKLWIEAPCYNGACDKIVMAI